MQRQPTSTHGKLIGTGEVGIYRRDARFIVRWNHKGKRSMRSFSTVDAARAFRRDVILPLRRRGTDDPGLVVPPFREHGWVYFMQSQGGDEAVKIGWSMNPNRRLAEVGQGHPYGLAIVALLPGGRAVEFALHRRFKEYRLGGEWFSREVVDALAVGLAVA